MSGSRRLIIFVKAPRIGLVKTRLGREIGPAAAAAAYRHLVELLLAKLAGLADVELCYAPDDAEEEIRPWRQPGWRMRPQGSGDLGERMRRAFRAARAEGIERTIIVGSDCPDVTLHDLEQAWDALCDHDVVLGPARDGGYWLIGLQQDQPILFEGIQWSTSTVLESTLQKCRTNGLSVFRLRELEDVDTAADWARVVEQRSGS